LRFNSSPTATGFGSGVRRHLVRFSAVGLFAVAGFAALLFSEAQPTAASTYFVAPNGLPSNDGTQSRPLDLDTALSSQGPVRPGDTVWLRGGIYRRQAGPAYNGVTALYVSTLNGTAASPIVVRQYPGERATLDGNLAPNLPVLVVDGSYTWFWGFEITNSNPSRSSSRGGGIDSYGHHNRFINLIIHDTGQGVGFWATSQADDSEIYGSVISHVGWEGGDRGHGHSIYVQNVNGSKRIADNILFEGFSFGVHAYTENGGIDNVGVTGNIAFNHGNLSATGGPKANILFAGGRVAQNPTVSGNFAYFPAGSTGRSVDISECNNGRVQSNYLAGGTPLKMSCSNTVVTGNTTYGPVAGSTQATHPSNTYGTTPAGVVVGIRPNAYEAGRANVAIFNWAKAPTVTVSLAAAGLVVGDSYEIRDAQNYFGAPVFTGVYSGQAVFPMTGLAAAPVVGNVPIQPGHTSAEFGAFVVQRASAGVTWPSATLTASPATTTAGGNTTLSWTTSGAASVSINQGIGSVAASGSRVVTPAATTTYTLTATNAGGTTTATAVVTVQGAASADGTIVPPASQIVDSQGAVWIMNGAQVLRNGAPAAGGSGVKMLYAGGSVYVLGSTGGSWWKWLGSGWSNVGTTQPGGTVTPPPPTPPPTGATSPDGTSVPTAAQIVDAQGAVWTIGGGLVLRNGVSAAGGSGVRILWSGGSIYVLSSTGGSWWKWLGAGWSNVGATQPGGTVTPPPATPPPTATTSPDGTSVPTATQIVDAVGAVWTLHGGAVLRNGVSAVGGSGVKILWSGGSIYVLSSTGGSWWKWLGAGWTNVGATQPGGTVTPPTTPPPTGVTSPDGTQAPPAAQIVDAQGAVWTLSGQVVLRNGAAAAGGTGFRLLWLRGTIYVLGSDNSRWWRWTGSSWTYFGTTQPT
jgi:hypothetical protein